MQLPIKRGQIFLTRTYHRNDDIYDSMAFSFIGMIMMRTKCTCHWYEMNLSVCKNGAVLLGNDNIIHLCAYLLFIWVSLTLIYAIAIFFSEYLQKTMDRRSDRNRSNVISKLYGLYDAKSIIIPRYNISWLVDGCNF